MPAPPTDPMNRPDPAPDHTLELPLMSHVIHVKIPDTKETPQVGRFPLIPSPNNIVSTQIPSCQVWSLCGLVVSRIITNIFAITDICIFPPSSMVSVGMLSVGRTHPCHCSGSSIMF